LLDTFSILIMNLIQGRTFIERFLVFILIICVNINSILFLFTFIVFVLSLKNELDPMKLELKFNISEEYFIDLDINNKNIL